jgi:hypothetical protein
LTQEKYNRQTDMRQSLNSFCSNYYYCNNCLSQYHKLVKGSIRYDSLVLCHEHLQEFKPIVKQLNDVFIDIEKRRPGTVKVITDLGLGGGE